MLNFRVYQLCNRTGEGMEESKRQKYAAKCCTVPLFPLDQADGQKSKLPDSISLKKGVCLHVSSLQ